MDVVSLSYFMFVYFLVCLQLHVSKKVGFRRKKKKEKRNTPVHTGYDHNNFFSLFVSCL